MTDQKHTAKEHSFLGQGWGFPIQFDVDEGCVALTGGVEDIEQSLLILLDTLPGERVTNLDYGCKVKSKIYDPVDGKFSFLAEEAIKDAISFYEPRIIVDGVRLNYERQNEGIVVIAISYIIKHTNARHNLVYPFSKLESNI
jgi:phage baseplate assembly protein W